MGAAQSQETRDAQKVANDSVARDTNANIKRINAQTKTNLQKTNADTAERDRKLKAQTAQDLRNINAGKPVGQVPQTEAPRTSSEFSTPE
jgi:hypothetical protein